MRRSILLLALGVTAGAAAVAFSASAQQSGTVLNLDAMLLKSGFSSQDRPPKGESGGDALQFRDRLSSDGGVVGRDAGICTRVSSSEQICTFTLVLDSGRIVAEGLAHDGDREYTIAIVGGTGAYEGTEGILRVSDATKAVAHYEVLLP